MPTPGDHRRPATIWLWVSLRLLRNVRVQALRRAAQGQPDRVCPARPTAVPPRAPPPHLAGSLEAAAHQSAQHRRPKSPNHPRRFPSQVIYVIGCAQSTRPRIGTRQVSLRACLQSSGRIAPARNRAAAFFAAAGKLARANVSPPSRRVRALRGGNRRTARCKPGVSLKKGRFPLVLCQFSAAIPLSRGVYFLSTGGFMLPGGGLPLYCSDCAAGLRNANAYHPITGLASCQAPLWWAGSACMPEGGYARTGNGRGTTRARVKPSARKRGAAARRRPTVWVPGQAVRNRCDFLNLGRAGREDGPSLIQ